MGGGLFDDDLPGEQEVAHIVGTSLSLTNLRVRYRGRGLYHNHAAYVRLADITSVGLGVRWTFQPALVITPIIAFATFALVGFFVGLAAWIAAAFVLLLATLPVMLLLMAGTFLRISAGGEAMKVRIPRRSVPEAKGFLKQIEEARQTLAERDAGPLAPSAPTARAYVR